MGRRAATGSGFSKAKKKAKALKKRPAGRARPFDNSIIVGRRYALKMLGRNRAGEISVSRPLLFRVPPGMHHTIHPYKC